MWNRAPWLCVLAMLGASPFARAQMKDAVEWLPAQTLACIEVRHPDRLSREVAALVKGSALDDLPRRLARLRTAGGPDMDWRIRSQLTMLSMFLCPEMIDEGGRIRGGFVALTGFAADNTPEVVGVLQTGDSNFPGIFMRGYLTESRIHIVDEVEGVSLYREQGFAGVVPPGVPAKQERGPVMAQLPGALLFGTSVDSLREVIRRAKGKNREASLTSLRAFKDAAPLRDRPGLFAYADMAALGAQLDEQTRKPGHPLASSWGILKTILGNEAVRNLTASLTLNGGTLECQVRANLSGKSGSPLLGLLPDKTAPRELLHFAPDDAMLAVTGGLGDGEKRWNTFLTLLDALDKLQDRGEANRLSNAIRMMEEKVKLQIGKDVLGPLTGVALTMDGFGDKQGGPSFYPLLILHASNEAAARELEEKGMPKLLGLAGGEVPVPGEKEVQGHRLRTVALGAAPRGETVYYGRQGAVLVVGLDDKRVAGALTAGGKKEGLLKNEKVGAAVQEVDSEAVTIGVLSSVEMVSAFFLLVGQPMAPGMGKMAVPVAPPPAAKPAPKDDAEATKAGRELRKAVSPLSPLVLSLNRKPDALVLEVRQVGLRRAVPALLDAWVASILESAGQGGQGFGAGAKMPAPAAKPKQ